MKQITKISIDLSKISEFTEAEESQKKLIADNPFIKVTDNASYEIAKQRRTALVRGRTSIEKQDKELASKLREFRGSVKSLADGLIGITKSAEEKQQSEITPYENKKEEERKEKERLKQIQMAEWNKKAQSILDYTDKLVNPKSLEEVETLISEVQNIDVSEEEFGAYELIAQQNKDKILEQATIVAARIKTQQDIEALRLRDELILAQGQYKEYFKRDLPDEHSKESLLKEIEDDKQGKLDRLMEFEKAEAERIYELEKAERERVKVKVKEYPLPKKESVEPVVNSDDLKAIILWSGVLRTALDNAPVVNSTEVLKGIVKKATGDLENIITFLDNMME